MTKKQILNELIKLIDEHYFNSYFMDNGISKNDKKAVRQFLEFRVFELETDKEY